VLLPLLAEFATAQKCSGQPDAPEFATIRCFKKRNTCRATCQNGYIFTEKKAKFAGYECQGGEWVMKGGEETRCNPLCEPDCIYGECVEPGVCQCDDGFTGNACDQEELEEYEAMTTTPEPEAYEEEDNYAEEEDYEDEDDYEDEEEHVEYEEHEEHHAVDEEGDDEGAETTEAPEAEDGDDEVEDDHQDDGDDDGVEDESHDDDNVDDGENGDDSTDDDVDGGDDDVDGGDDDDVNGGDDDDEEEDNSPMEAAYGGASEVVPKILVGTAALLMVRAL